MLEVTVAWERHDNIQRKSFKTETDFIVWYDKNFKKIVSINGRPNMVDLDSDRPVLDHMELLAIIRGL